MSSAETVEKAWFNLDRRGYRGSYPPFHRKNEFPVAEWLEANYATIENEILDFYTNHAEELPANFSPYNFYDPGWKTINLCTYYWMYKKGCRSLPFLYRMMLRFPEISLISVSVFRPGTYVKGHYGDSNAIVRIHLGITVPAGLPACGIQVRNHIHAWQEGKVLLFTDAHRHRAWNLSDGTRIALIVDVFRKEYFDQRFWISAGVLAAIFMKTFATRFPALKKLPGPITTMIHTLLRIAFRVALPINRWLNKPDK